MKIAAILVPVALFLIWSFAGMAISASNTKRSKGEECTRPIPRKDSKRLVISMYLLMFVIFTASVAWSAYVFTRLIWLSVLFFLIWPLLVLVPILLARRRMPKTPPGGWPDEKARLDAFAKWREERQKQTHKRGWLFYIRWLIGIILSVWGSAITVVALWSIIAPGPDDSLGTSIFVMLVLGILPLAIGIVLCIFAGKKWIKPKAKHQEKQNPPPSPPHTP